MAKNLQNARALAYTRQRGICIYCKRPTPTSEATLEHRLPLSRGGRTNKQNAAMACRSCNEAKGSMTEAEFLAYRSGPAPSLPRARVALWLAADKLSARTTAPERLSIPARETVL